MFSEIVFNTDRPLIVSQPNVRIIQREFFHDVASVALVWGGRGRHLDKGTPVTIRWGNPPNDVKTFLGYINHTQPMQLPNPGTKERNQIKIVCKSASSALSTPLMASWQNRNATSIVQELLRRYQLSGMVQADKRIFPSLSCSGQTAWKFLVDLAQKLGWTVFARGTDVTFRDPVSNLDDLKKQALIFVGQPLTPLQSNPEATVRSFHGITGHTDGGINAVRVAYGLDARLLNTFSIVDAGAAGDPPAMVRYEHVPATTYGEASDQLAGEARRNRWHIQAKAEVVGHARVHQTDVICLVNVGQRESGFWYVEQAEHELNETGYRMHLNLGRDASWDTGERPPSGRAERVVRPRYDPFGTQIDAVPPPVLVNRIWRAAYAAERPVTGVA